MSSKDLNNLYFLADKRAYSENQMIKVVRRAIIS